MRGTAADADLDALFETPESPRRTGNESWSEAWRQARGWYLAALYLAALSLTIVVVTAEVLALA